MKSLLSFLTNTKFFIQCKLRNFWPFELNIFIASNVSSPSTRWRGQKDSWHFKQGIKGPDKVTIELEANKIFFFQNQDTKKLQEDTKDRPGGHPLVAKRRSHDCEARDLNATI